MSTAHLNTHFQQTSEDGCVNNLLETHSNPHSMMWQVKRLSCSCSQEMMWSDHVENACLCMCTEGNAMK